MSTIYALSWNKDQMSSHIENLVDYLDDCVQKSLKNEPQNWVLLKVGENKKLEMFLEVFKEKNECYQAYKKIDSIHWMQARGKMY